MSPNFQIPEIVIEEYMSSYSLDNLSKSYTEDYIWLKDSDFKCPKLEWFVDNCDSINAEYLLRNKPDGTFLVRKSLRYEGHYVLAVSYHNFIYNLIINKTEKGFGLIQPGVHPSLESLITYYSQVSLNTKNEHLDTKLIKGVFQ